MRVNCIKIISLILSTILLCGCWDSKEIQFQTIISAVVVDYKDDEYHFYTECAKVLVAGAGGQGGKIEFSMLQSKGKTFAQARDHLERGSSLPIFLEGGMHILIFTENFCNHGIEEYLNRARGEHDYRKSVRVITTIEDPEELLNFKPHMVSSVGSALENTVRSMADFGDCISVSIGDILEHLAAGKVGFLIPMFNLENEQAVLADFCVMKENVCVGHIPAEERDGTMSLSVPRKEFEYTLEFNGNKYTILVKLKKRKIKPRHVNGNICFDIKLSYEGVIVFAEKIVKLSKKQVKEMEKRIEQEFLLGINDALDMAQNEFGCDYLDFYKHYKAKYQNNFKKIEDWNEAFSNAIMNPEVDFHIVGDNLIEFLE